MRNQFKCLLAALLLCCVASPVLAQFSGSGSGTADDPYRIYNAVQLNQVRNFVGIEDVYFSLEADIDMTDWIAENNPAQGWQPIGNSSSAAAFKGVFNGNGHTISNLWINRPDTDYIGLFGYVINGSISDLNIIDIDFVGQNRVGGISGALTSTNLRNVFVEGMVNGENHIGGMVGYYNLSEDACEISSCSFKGIIEGAKYVGGVLGYVYSSVVPYYSDNSDLSLSNCITDCTINVLTSDAGGIVGCITMSGAIQNIDRNIRIDGCQTICNVQGGDRIGGIVGYQDFSNPVKGDIYIENCYAHIIASSCEDIGAILGSVNSYSMPSIESYNTNNYSTGIIAGKRSIGGLLGEHIGSDYYSHFYSSYSQLQKISGENTVAGLCNGGTIDNSIAINNVIETTNGDDLGRVRLGDGSAGNNLAWTLTTMIANGERLPIPADDAENGTSTGLSTLKLQATYEGLGWDFNDIWKIEETESFPYFQWQTAPPYFSQTLKKGDTHLSGQCTEQGTVTVRVGDKRYTVQSAGNAWSVDLEEPLDAGDMVEIWVQAEEKMPSYVVCVTAGLSGSGTETDPYLITSAEDLQAISDITDDNSHYRLTADIDLADYIAENGWTPVTIRGHFDGQGHTVSGLQCEAETAGLFHTLNAGGEIKNLKVIIATDGTLKGSLLAGGLVGNNKGTITNCSVSGNVEGATIAGCIAGISSGSISECYTKGNVSSSAGEAHMGGIVGENSAGGKVSDCCSDVVTDASGSNAYGGGIVGYNYGKVEYCYATGDVTGYTVAGVCGYNSGAAAELKGCVAANSNLSGSKQALRVVGGFSSDATAPGLTDNYAVSDMVVSVNGVPQTIYDDPLNGTAMPESELMKQSTYEVENRRRYFFPIFT